MNLGIKKGSGKMTREEMIAVTGLVFLLVFAAVSCIGLYLSYRTFFAAKSYAGEVRAKKAILSRDEIAGVIKLLDSREEKLLEVLSR